MGMSRLRIFLVGWGLFLSGLLSAQTEPRTHMVQQGETLYSLSKTYGIPIEQIIQANPEVQSGLKVGMALTIPEKSEGAPQTAAPVYQPDSSDVRFYYHVIKPRQTLYGVTKAYEVSLEDIESANPWVAQQGLQIGSVLKIPKPLAEVVQNTRQGDTISHIVQPGETIYSLCRKYSVNADVFFKLNPHTVDGLKEGQEIKLPIRDEDKTSRTTTPPKTSGDQYKLYQIKKNDSLEHILKEHQISKEDLFDLNPEVREGLIPDRYIIIPPKGRARSKDVQTTMTQPTSGAATRWPEKRISESVAAAKTQRIAVLLPFEMPKLVDEDLETDDEADAEPKSQRKVIRRPDIQMSLEFYSGFKMAMADLANMGYDIELLVMDVKAENTNLTTIENQLKEKKIEAVVGPLYARQALQIASAVSNNQIPVFSPLSRGLDNSSQANLISCVPAKTNEYLRIAEAMNQEFYGAQIVFVNPDTPENRAALRTMRKAMHPRDSSLVHEVWSNRARDLSGFVRNDQHTVFITVDQNKAFLTDLVSKLFALRDRNIRLLSTTDLFQIETIEIRYLNQIKYTGTELFYVDYNHAEVIDFVKRYRERYFTDPSRFAFQGYDLGLYVAGLQQNSNNALTLPEKRGFSTGFVFDTNGTGGPQNRFVFLMELRDMEFRPLNGN
jgi:peptidoglycan DL-endopeptidase LytF